MVKKGESKFFFSIGFTEAKILDVLNDQKEEVLVATIHEQLPEIRLYTDIYIIVNRLEEKGFVTSIRRPSIGAAHAGKNRWMKITPLGKKVYELIIAIREYEAEIYFHRLSA